MTRVAEVRTRTPQRTTIATLQRLAAIGGRFSTALGIDVESGDAEIDRWFLAATLFGARLPTTIAERTFHVLDQAGVTVATARAFTWDDLVALLDRGGYVRFDFKTATRLHALCDVLVERYDGRVCAIPGRVRTPAELEAALDDLPGWGPVTVGVFLRELRGVWELACPALDARARSCAVHLRLLEERCRDPLARVGSLSAAAGSDPRDLEAALVRTALAHHGGLAGCPGGSGCVVLAQVVDRPWPEAPVGGRR
jgi:endonuclease III